MHNEQLMGFWKCSLFISYLVTGRFPWLELLQTKAKEGKKDAEEKDYAGEEGDGLDEACNREGGETTTQESASASAFPDYFYC